MREKKKYGLCVCFACFLIWCLFFLFWFFFFPDCFMFFHHTSHKKMTALEYFHKQISSSKDIMAAQDERGHEEVEMQTVKSSDEDCTATPKKRFEL